MTVLDLPAVEAVPLRRWDDDSIRVGDSRITLPVFLEAYRLLGSAEALAERFPSLNRADIYGVLSYYHRHREILDAYLAESERAADELQARIEHGSPASDWHEELQERARARGLLE